MTVAQRSLVERDSTVVGLGVLVDRSSLGDWLAEHEVPSRDAALTYLRYKPGTSLTAALSVAGGPAFAYAVAPHALPKIEKAVRRAPAGSVLAYDPRRRILLARPSADRDLPGLRTLAVEETLAYKPQRRWVGLVRRERAGAPTSVLRCYRPSDAAAAVDRWPDPGGPVRVPEVRELDRRLGTLVLERLPGLRLSTMTGAAGLDAWQRTGQMLGRWHARAGAAPGRAPLPDPAAVAREVAWVLPEEGARAAELAARVTAGPADTDVGWCHGDFSADQVLVEDHSEPALLDWDRSGTAPRAMDLANADAAGMDRSQWEALLTGYTEVRPAPPALDRARARCHFLRVTEPFRQADPAWPRLVRARLDRTEELA